MSNPTSPTFPEIDDLKTKLKTNTPLIPLFKGVLKKILKQQQQQFLEAPKDTVEHLVKQRSQVIDQLLILVWQQFFSESQSISLIAGGGYGRGELHPHSDIDLMILVANDDLQDHQEAIESFLTFLWDIGLDVGHSVRSINESISECKEDITIATNLMESRLIIGEETHFQSMREQTTSDQTWTGTRFFEAKLEEQKKRHLKFHDTAYNLEPNIKENPGGLRDIQAIGWVAKRHFNVDRLDDLVDKGFLTPIELDTLKQGQNYLWRIRFALHIIAKRREDRFLFDHQRTVAEILGFKDTKTIAAVESMMQSYFRTVLELNRLNELLLQLFKEAILYPTDNPTIQPINNRFQSHNGYLETVSDNVFKRTPFALLEFFLIKQQHPELKGIRASTIRLIRDNTHLIDDQFRQDIRNISLFIEIMRQPHGLTHELRRMNRYGILAAYLPVFNNIVGRMQYDLFHIYTVDEHTLMVIRNLRRMTVPTFAHELPHCSEIIQQIPKQELLYLAGLFHDIAKGRGGDHSKLGAMDAEQFCQLHRLGQYDTKLVTWIIRSHLIMSSTAQRKDISDPDVVLEFANIVGDVNHLNYLYLLTIADIRATDPKLWNSWKDSLLKELYHKTKIALQQDPGKLINRNELIQD
ncbi:MAG: [protein-PII] uridylyltransferase, partial [Methylococcales bacterium]|nr:[protein-PII] uridylyltransferase [Methylococcales bacterium]